MTDLYWLPEIVDWRTRMCAVAALPPADVWNAVAALARTRMDLLRTHQLDVMLRRLCPVPPPGLTTRPVRLALLGSSTLGHLAAAIRVGAARRGLFVTIHEAAYGQYVQELTDPASSLHAFQPDIVLVALDGFHLAALPDAPGRLAETWRLARAAFGCRVIQQTPLPVHPRLMGSSEHRLADSHAAALERLNHKLRDMTAAEGVDLLAIDACAAQDGLLRWHDPALWHRAKQEITPAAAALYGDLVGRLLAAAQGRSAKCLVLDLDNTLWGGVVGDEGPDGLVLGQGSAQGEAFVAFQHYARALSRRGIILAVCSKNDAENAAVPFDSHPEMALRRSDIACFVANWQDKPANLRAIASALNIGLDSLVFADDNPFERSLVRAELPMIAVPELPDDPALYARTLADAGYFEALAITEEDRARAGQYQNNQARAASQAAATDLASYLRGLGMELLWRPFDRLGLPRIVQLINKTNQFNLTTRRITEAEVQAVIDDPAAFGLQFRLVDRFGDNGVVAIVIGRRDGGGDARIDTWLMSCRVLGRQVEAATLGVVAAEAVRLGARRLIGEYVPSGRNAMVKDHYANLGFTVIATDETGASRAVLALSDHAPPSTFIAVKAG